jgi:hypothetical protein
MAGSRPSTGALTLASSLRRRCRPAARHLTKTRRAYPIRRWVRTRVLQKSAARFLVQNVPFSVSGLCLLSPLSLIGI